MSSGVELIVVALSGGAANLVERRKARRELLARPAIGTTTEEGTVVRVTGVVRALDTMLVAPLSGRDCVVYRSRFQALGGITPRETLAARPFAIDRPEGRWSSIAST